jgi:hypothetical protein
MPVAWLAVKSLTTPKFFLSLCELGLGNPKPKVDLHFPLYIIKAFPLRNSYSPRLTTKRP